MTRILPQRQSSATKCRSRAGRPAARPSSIGLIERDVAEIELARDRLLAEPVPARRSSPAGRAAARTSDHVPVIVGGLLAFASIVVFAAAASLVSLR